MGPGAGRFIDRDQAAPSAAGADRRI